MLLEQKNGHSKKVGYSTWDFVLFPRFSKKERTGEMTDRFPKPLGSSDLADIPNLSYYLVRVCCMRWRVANDDRDRALQSPRMMEYTRDTPHTKQQLPQIVHSQQS